MLFHKLSLAVLFLASRAAAAPNPPVPDETCAAADCSASSLAPGGNDEPNPPFWPNTVKVVDPSVVGTDQMQDILSTIQDVPQEWNDNDHNNVTRPGFNSEKHFVEDRYAVLFAPGNYSLDIEVGYYAQVVGLGKSASDVKFVNTQFGPYVPALNKYKLVGDNCPNPDTCRPGLSLDTFWRAAENFYTEACQGQLWAVSQAAPLRRVHIAKSSSACDGNPWERESGNLYLHDAGARASGGHLANAQVDGKLYFGSQQQWLCRSVNAKNGTEGGAWSLVFVDCEGEIPLAGPGGVNEVSVTVDSAPRITVEKPFIALRDDKKYDLHVPAPRKRDQGGDALGTDLSGETDDVRDFSRVYVANATRIDEYSKLQVPDGEVASKINDALASGKDIVLSPGMYYLKQPLVLNKVNQTLLGLGLATLVAPVDGQPCIKVVSKTAGVRIAGIMLEASVIPDEAHRSFTASLLEWGDEDIPDDDGNEDNPGVLTDIFARVGGSNLDRKVSTDTMVRIHSGNVVGDNLWLWRADHVKLRPNEDPNFMKTLGLDYHQVMLGECPVKTGLEVNGNNVTIHGLAVEHTTEHQTVWNGDGGNVMFYQSELPYDVTPLFGEEGFLGYKVSDGVKSHTAGGVGVYSNFRDYHVPVKTAIGIGSLPSSGRRLTGGGVNITNPFTVWLDNNGTIESIINDEAGSPPLTGKGSVSRWQA